MAATDLRPMRVAFGLKVVSMTLLVGIAHCPFGLRTPAAEGPTLPSLSISAPFTLDEAVENLRKLVPSIPPDIDPFLRSIQSISYDFEWHERCTFKGFCAGLQPDDHVWVVRRTLLLSADQIAPTIRSALAANEEDACSSKKFPNLRRVAVLPDYFLYAADVRAKKRACGDIPFDGQWKTDIAEANGTVAISVRLEKSPPDIETFATPGSFRFVPNADARIDNQNLLGFINVNSVVGQIITLIVKLADGVIDFTTFNVAKTELDKLIQFLNTSRYAVGTLDYYARDQNLVISSLPTVYDMVEAIGSYTRKYVLDVDQTYLLQSAGKDALRISYYTLVLDVIAPLYYGAKQQEIKDIDSLDEPDDVHVVSAGENLWALAATRYDNPDAMFRIGEINNMKDLNELYVGAEIILPPRWKLSTDLEGYVMPGETIWSRYIKDHAPETWNPGGIGVPVGSSSIDRIFPLQRVSIK